VGVAAEDLVAEVEGDMVTVGDAEEEVETVALENEDGDVEGDPEEDLVADVEGVIVGDGEVVDDNDNVPVGEPDEDVVGEALDDDDDDGDGDFDGSAVAAAVLDSELDDEGDWDGEADEVTVVDADFEDKGNEYSKGCLRVFVLLSAMANLSLRPLESRLLSLSQWTTKMLTWKQYLLGTMFLMLTL